MELTEARAYLVETASPGYTMTRQGPGLAVERLHPEFAIRLANAIREARESGLHLAGIFSAYRPPAFGVGGFSDKFNSLHAYGLAVDLSGIGEPGSVEAERWHEIAARRGVICPYGPHNKAEWNHCQPTSLKLVLAGSPITIATPATLSGSLTLSVNNTTTFSADLAGASGERQQQVDQQVLARQVESRALSALSNGGVEYGQVATHRVDIQKSHSASRRGKMMKCIWRDKGAA